MSEDQSSKPDPESRDLEEALLRLRRASGLMRQDALLLVFCTGVNALCPIIRYGVSLPEFAATLPLWFSIVFTAAAVFVLGMFEVIRHSANAYFEEISDELQWMVVGGGRRYRDGLPSDAPGLEIRLALRSYANAENLPFIGGKMGPLAYVLLNFSLCALTAALEFERGWF